MRTHETANRVHSLRFVKAGRPAQILGGQEHTHMQALGGRHRALGAGLELGRIVDFVVDDDEHDDLLSALQGPAKGPVAPTCSMMETDESEQLADL